MKKYMILLAALVVAAGCEKGRNDDLSVRRSLTFTADAVATKTALGADWSVSWVDGDPVSILWDGGKAQAKARLEDGKALFSATVGEAENYWCVYPSTVGASLGPDGEISFPQPLEQSGRFEDCAVITSRASRETLDFGRFHSAVGLVQFTLTDNSITRVLFTSTEENILIHTAGKGTYYFALLPGTHLQEMSFRLGTDSAWKGTAIGGEPVETAAGQILCIRTPLNEKMTGEDDIVITNEEMLLAALQGDGGALDGKTLRVKAGTYHLGLSLNYAEAISFTIKGEEGTVFTGDHACLTVSSGKANLTLEGITFQDCTNDAEGGALCLKTGVHEIRGCTFTGNAITSTTSDRTGGAIYVGGTASADITGCTFTGNKVKVTGGGALAFYAATTSRVLNCVFKDNNPDKIGNGGAILQKKADGYLFVAGCSFDGNACTTNGADIFSSAGAALLLYNCTGVNPVNTSAGNLGFVRANVPMFMACCTYAAQTVGEANGCVAFGTSGTEKNSVINNLVVCDAGNAFSSAFTNNNPNLTRQVASYGYNVFTRAPKIVWTASGTGPDLEGTTCESIFTGAPALSAAGVLVWSGPSTLGEFKTASASDVEAAMKGYALGGAAFYDYLTENEAFAVDGAGNPRTGAWWPGAYQGAE